MNVGTRTSLRGPSSGFCECGCGEPTRIAPKTDRSKQWERGKPLRFIRGHNAHLTNRPRRRFSDADYSIEDHGYETSCWIWNGRPTSAQGYCRVGRGGRYQAAHRAYYEQFVGLIPEGYDLHHRCEQHACVRPEHLEPVPKSAHLAIHKRKLTDDDVRAIRRDRRPLREIAATYRMSYSYICSVRTGLVRREVLSDA